MTLEEKLRSMHQGLPGLGVGAGTGSDGRRGLSIYVGHVKDFFDGIMLTEDEKGYLRIKNQKYYRLPENKNFYYKNQSNFYKALTEEVERMTTFSIYNLRGMYLRPGSLDGEEYGANDFGRFGWSLDLHRLIKNQQEDRNWGSKDPGVASFKNWLSSFSSAEELNNLDGKLFIKYQDDDSDEETSDSSKGELYFKYISLNRDIIGDPSYPNAYSSDDFDNAAFNVNIGNHIDESNIDVGGIDYLNERSLNQDMTNFNVRYTNDVLIPTSLSTKYKEGDILYFLDDITNDIISYLVITPDIVQCRYEYFLSLSTIPIKSLLSPFREGDRVTAYKNIVLSSLEVGDEVSRYKNNAVDNFIKKYDNNFSLSLVTNKRDRIQWINLLVGEDKKLELSSPLDSSSGSQLSSQDKRFFKIKAHHLQLDNIWLKNICTNVNIPEYNNDNIVLVDGLHVDNIDERDFLDDYKKISVRFSKFFYSFNSGDEYGVIFMNSDGHVLKTYRFTSNDPQEIPYVDDLSISSATSLRVMTYANSYHTTRYYSDIAAIDIDPIAKRAQYSKNDLVDEIQDLYDNDYFTFNSSSITCENSIIDIVVEPSEDVIIDKIYLNGNPLNDSVVSWISYISENSEISEDKASLSFFIENNLPNDNDVDQRTVAEYLLSLSNTKEIGSLIEETNPRTAIITAVGHKGSQIVRSSHKIVQPGFENPLYDVSIDFNNLINNNILEESNSSENGVLCNQIQMFTEISILGFTNSRWATYLEDPKIYIYLNLNNDIDSKADTDETNFNNVHFYSLSDKNMFANNAVKMKFSWIPNTSSVSYDSSVFEIETEEKELPSYASVFGNANDDTFIEGEWVYISDSSFLSNKDSYIPKDLIYRIEDDTAIGGISIAEANSNRKIKIRTVAEIGNPIPMEFNVKWIVDKIEIRGKIKPELRPQDNLEFWDEEELVFKKMFEDEQGFQYNPVSKNTKIVVNPIYMSACPSDEENMDSARIGVAIMNVGPTDEPKIKVGVQDIGQDAKDEFFLQKRYDLAINRLKESRGNHNYISDITFYWPKKKYFQDNIQNVHIKPRDFKNDVISKSITPKNSPFVSLLEDLKPSKSILQNMYNISLLDVNDTLNSEYSKSFLMSEFNGYAMNPEYRNEELTFYYNSKLYQERLYDQWNSISPLWSEQEATIEVVDASLLEAKHNWNYEYEVSEDYVKGKSRGGVTTKSGDGYLELSSEESIEKYDTGQYSTIGALGLRETLEESEKYALEDPEIFNMSIPEGFVNMPKKGEFFRTMLYDMKWIYPYFININNTLMVFPYYFANSYEAWLDYKVMEDYIATRSHDTLAELKDFIDNTDIFEDEISREEYKKNKINEYVYFVRNNYLSFDHSEDKSKVNMLIPYNVCYDIYPRTMLNIDCKNTVNVFMLQKPTVVDGKTYSLDKHYFKIPLFTDDELENEYYSGFEDGKQVVAPVLPPWNFNK